MFESALGGTGTYSRPHLLERTDQRLGRRRIHELEVQEVVDTQALEHEDNVAHVGALNLRHRVVLQLMLI